MHATTPAPTSAGARTKLSVCDGPRSSGWARGEGSQRCTGCRQCGLAEEGRAKSPVSDGVCAQAHSSTQGGGKCWLACWEVLTMCDTVQNVAAQHTMLQQHNMLLLARLPDEVFTMFASFFGSMPSESPSANASETPAIEIPRMRLLQIFATCPVRVACGLGASSNQARRSNLHDWKFRQAGYSDPRRAVLRRRRQPFRMGALRVLLVFNGIRSGRCWRMDGRVGYTTSSCTLYMYVACRTMHVACCMVTLVWYRLHAGRRRTSHAPVVGCRRARAACPRLRPQC